MSSTFSVVMHVIHAMNPHLESIRRMHFHEMNRTNIARHCGVLKTLSPRAALTDNCIVQKDMIQIKHGTEDHLTNDFLGRDSIDSLPTELSSEPGHAADNSTPVR